MITPPIQGYIYKTSTLLAPSRPTTSTNYPATGVHRVITVEKCEVHGSGPKLSDNCYLCFITNNDTDLLICFKHYIFLRITHLLQPPFLLENYLLMSN